MAAANGFPRVALYSHDTFGLGHLTRSTRIARAVVDAFPGSSVLLLSGSPVAHRFVFPPRVDYVKLPAVVKAGHETYVARELNMSNRGIRRMRAQLILDAVSHFRPHLLLVDNVPLGMRGELLPTLEMLRRDRPSVRIHLNLRDVLDDPSALLPVWESLAVPEALHRLYDAIHIFGAPDVFDAVARYDLPAEKCAYLGYIAPYEDELARAPEMPPADPRRARILVTAGGGGDGAEILLAVACLQRSLGPASPYHFDLVAGPLMDPLVREAVSRELHALSDVTRHEFVEGMPAWMARSDLVLSMGGYNTLCEVLALARRCVVVPRVHPRREQEIRARAFEARGLLRVLDPGELGPQALDRVLREALATSPLPPGVRRPPLTGIAAFQKRLASLLEVRSAPAPAPAPGRDRSAPAVSRPHQTPALKARRPRDRHRGTLLTAIALALGMGGAIPDAGASLRPTAAEARIWMGYDSNLLDASKAERRAFEQQTLRLQARPPAGARVTLEAAHRPQVYARHRVDRDALPGMPIYRAETYRRLRVGLTWREYHSRDPEDGSHHGRRDRMQSYELVLGHALSERVKLEAGYVVRHRTARLPSGAAVEYDDEGAFHEGVTHAGLTWHWERP